MRNQLFASDYRLRSQCLWVALIALSSACGGGGGSNAPADSTPDNATADSRADSQSPADGTSTSDASESDVTATSDTSNPTDAMATQDGVATTDGTPVGDSVATDSNVTDSVPTSDVATNTDATTASDSASTTDSAASDTGSTLDSQATDSATAQDTNVADVTSDSVTGCEAGVTRCNANGNVDTCTSGAWLQTSTCPLGCANGQCTSSVTCTPSSRQCANGGVEVCNASGSGWLYAATCANGCSNGACAGSCTANATQCSADGTSLQTCTGGTWVSAACASNSCDSLSATCALTSLTITPTTTQSFDGVIVVDGPVIVENGATLTSTTGNLTIRATSITVQAGGSIQIAATGTLPAGQGADGYYYSYYGSYYNATGGSNKGGSTQDSIVTAGSPGGAAYNSTTALPGGGVLQLIAPTITVAGSITANGASGSGCNYGSCAAGGSGGAVLLAADTLNVASTAVISTAGGAAAGSNPAGNAGFVKLLGNTSTIAGTVTGTKVTGLTPPMQITSSSHPNPAVIYNDGAPTLVLSWVRPFPSAIGYYYRLDQTAPGSDSTPSGVTSNGGIFTASETVSLSPSQLGAGNNYFHIVSVDAQSNTGKIESVFTIEINKAPPALTSASHTQTGWSTTNTVNFSWTGNGMPVGWYYVFDHYGRTIPATTDTSLPVSQVNLIRSPVSTGAWAMHLISINQKGYLTLAASHYRVLIGTAPTTYGSISGTIVNAAATPVVGATVTINRGLFAMVAGDPGDQTSIAGGAFTWPTRGAENPAWHVGSLGELHDWRRGNSGRGFVGRRHRWQHHRYRHDPDQVAKVRTPPRVAARAMKRVGDEHCGHHSACCEWDNGVDHPDDGIEPKRGKKKVHSAAGRPLVFARQADVVDGRRVRLQRDEDSFARSVARERPHGDVARTTGSRRV